MLTPTQQFAVWLQGFLDACGKDLNETQTEKVKAKLNDIFIHEAAPAKLSLEELGEQHGFPVKPGFPGSWQGHDSDEEGVAYRC